MPGLHPWQAHDFGPQHSQARQGTCQRNSFGQPVFGQAAATVRADIGMQNKGPCGACFGLIGFKSAVFGERIEVFILFWKIANQSSPS